MIPHNRRCRRGERAQEMVEFALVVPVFIALVVGILSGALLFMQDQSVNNAARAGARAALVQTSLAKVNSTGTQLCESGTDVDGSVATIEGAAQHASNVIPVNPAPMCQPGSPDPAGGTLVQTATADDTQLTIGASPNITTPTQITATATKTAMPLWPFLSTSITLRHTSTITAQ